MGVVGLVCDGNRVFALFDALFLLYVFFLFLFHELDYHQHVVICRVLHNRIMLNDILLSLILIWHLLSTSRLQFLQPGNSNFLEHDFLRVFDPLKLYDLSFFSTIAGCFSVHVLVLACDLEPKFGQFGPVFLLEAMD